MDLVAGNVKPIRLGAVSGAGFAVTFWLAKRAASRRPGGSLTAVGGAELLLPARLSVLLSALPECSTS